MVKEGHFLEHARVFDDYYGTSREVVERLLQQGKDVVLDIDWQGARAIKEKMPQVKGVFILPPSRVALRGRLAGRRQDSRGVIERRMRDAVSEMTHYKEFDYIVVNDDFDAALGDLKAILSGDLAQVRPVSVDIAALFAG